MSNKLKTVWVAIAAMFILAFLLSRLPDEPPKSAETTTTAPEAPTAATPDREADKAVDAPVTEAEKTWAIGEFCDEFKRNAGGAILGDRYKSLNEVSQQARDELAREFKISTERASVIVLAAVRDQGPNATITEVCRDYATVR
jgi:hypothetical protein